MKFDSGPLEGSRSLKAIKHVLEIKAQIAIEILVTVLQVLKRNMAEMMLTMRTFCLKSFSFPPILSGVEVGLSTWLNCAFLLLQKQ